MGNHKDQAFFVITCTFSTAANVNTFFDNVEESKLRWLTWDKSTPPLSGAKVWIKLYFDAFSNFLALSFSLALLDDLA